MVCCPVCANGSHGEPHELWCPHGPQTMTMGELREKLIEAIELYEVNEGKHVGLLVERPHWNGGTEQRVLPLRFAGVHFVRGQFVFLLAEVPANVEEQV